MKRINKTTLENNFTIEKYSHAPLNKARRYTLFINTERLISGKNRTE